MEKNDYIDEQEEKKPNIILEIFSFILYMAVVVGFSFFVITYVGQRTYVSGSSMENTLSDGDNLIVDKITYRFS
ncbi:MAG: S26 family signal peptidase, partial [Lachnospiraceae bacterium]|nr:S26 family signal peptidase [Lachnospiraceae bacterium]